MNRVIILLVFLFSSSVQADSECRVIDNLITKPLYKGKCVNGLANGYGVVNDKDLAISYKGQLRNGKFNGQGKLVSKQKDGTEKIWDGNWRNGELNGKGKFSSSTFTYQGEWLNGKSNGQGVQKTLSSGKTFTGQFKNNNWYKGRLVFSDGTYTQGVWMNNKLNGYVIETMKSGAMYKGQYRNGKRHGKGSMIFTDGTSTTGVWVNGKPTSGDVMKLLGKSNPAKPQKPRYTAAVPSGGVIESKIDGEFEGWEGETVFKLMNGQIWQQSSYNYRYHYAFMPNVLIYPSNGRHKMKVDGIKDTIYVQRLR